MLKTEELLNLVKESLEERKAKEIRILDVRKVSNVTEMMVVASGTSKTHVNAIAEYVVVKAKEQGHRPLGQEGFEEGEWVLLDLGDVIVHVMQPLTRDFYQLEKLWSEMGEDERLQKMRIGSV